MAEGWGKSLDKGQIKFYSAGIELHGLNLNAVDVMAERGVDIKAHQSKTLRALEGIEFDLVYTVCSHANETCPVFPGNAQVVHVPFDDPPKLPEVTGDPLFHYRRVRDEIELFVVDLLDSLAVPLQE